MTVLPQLDSVQLSQDQNGLKFQQDFEVLDIVGATSLADQLYKALTAAGTNGIVIPNYYDPLAEIPGIFVNDKSITGWAATDARVRVVWGTPTLRFIPQDHLRVEGSAAVSEIQTEKDRDGNRIWVDYAPPGGQKQGPQGGSVRQFVAYPRIRFIRKEDESPEWELTELVGQLNRTEWRGFDPYTWMYADCNFYSDDGERTFLVTREFMADNYDHFKQIIRWIDPLTGRPPKIDDVQAAINAENGLKELDNQYFAFDFGAEFGF